MSADGVRVVFTPSGRQGEVPAGTTVLDAARSLGVDLDSICGGRGICGRCQVQLGASKNIALDPSRVSGPNSVELDYHGARPLEPGNRLGCQMHVLGDVVVDIPVSSRVHRQVVRKRPEVPDIDVDPVVRLYYLELAASILGETESGQRRVLNALAEQWDLTGIHLDPRALPDLQAALAEGKGAITVAVHDGRDLTAVWPGFRDRMLGVAFDVGSTTIAGHLCDLHTGEILATHGEMNPQIRFGEDVMSRVSYAMMDQGGAAQLTEVVQGALDDIVGALVDEAGVAREDILEVVLVGNPIMHHLFLGLDPTPLGTAPFELATNQAVRIDCSELGISVHPRGRTYVLPCIAGHVGADAAAAMLSEAPQRSEAVQLLVDVGTNAEIVLGNSQRLLAASSPTGPAFEGAQISAGQRAAPGAIERVRIDPETLEPRIKIIGGEHWSDEEGFFQEIADTPVTGICGSGIIEVIAGLYLAGVIDEKGTIRGDAPTDRVVADDRTFAYVLWTDPQILVTQNDVRAVQLAKAALHAGARLLMDHYGTDRVDQIRLAGAFGNHIDPLYAMVLGMIPDCDLAAVSGAGNAAGSGAIMALLSRAARDEVEGLVERVEKIETATEPRFQEHFVAALGIPNETASFPHLSGVVTLPAPTGGPTRRRRRNTDE
ncbi:MAG TPA: ASKHA domain-containing protein [Acidimicrobiia bacterium]|nr:ASKHA domain-containing protein [Acidimicrobiia bacterium]